MKAHSSLAAVVLAGSLLAAAAAHAASPQIPTPANPFPENPVSTDGTSLLTGRHVGGDAGRSVAAGARRGSSVGGFFALEPGY